MAGRIPDRVTGTDERRSVSRTQPALPSLQSTLRSAELILDSDKADVKQRGVCILVRESVGVSKGAGGESAVGLLCYDRSGFRGTSAPTPVIAVQYGSFLPLGPKKWYWRMLSYCIHLS